MQGIYAWPEQGAVSTLASVAHLWETHDSSLLIDMDLSLEAPIREPFAWRTELNCLVGALLLPKGLPEVRGARASAEMPTSMYQSIITLRRSGMLSVLILVQSGQRGVTRLLS